MTSFRLPRTFHRQLRRAVKKAGVDQSQLILKCLGPVVYEILEERPSAQLDLLGSNPSSQVNLVGEIPQARPALNSERGIRMWNTIFCAFLEGFSGGSLFTKAKRPDAPTRVFAAEGDEDYPQRELVQALIQVQRRQDGQS